MATAMNTAPLKKMNIDAEYSHPAIFSGANGIARHTDVLV
jgi:hypothetical protein